MDKLNIPGTTNGIPFNWDDLEFMMGQGSYDGGLIEAIEGILARFGDNFIVSGCVLSGGNYTAGWIFLDGELLKVDAHAVTDPYWEKTSSYNSNGNKQTQLSGTVDIYLENRGTASSYSGTLAADGNEPRLGNVSWTTITLINGWTGAGTARYRIHIDGTCEIDLDLDTDLASGITNNIFGTIPAAARPTQHNAYFLVQSGISGVQTPRLMTITTAGNVSIDYTATDIYKTNVRYPLT
jgi:hypothetical protein